MKKIIYTLAVLFLFLQAKSQTTGSQTSTPGQTDGYYIRNTPAWTNLSPESLRYDDNNYAYIQGFQGSTSGYTFLSHFVFSIPTDATITGLTLTMRKFSTGNVVKDYEIYFLNGYPTSAYIIGSNLANQNAWPTTENSITYYQAGNVTNTFTPPSTYTWIPADINGGFAIQFNFQKNSGKPANVYLDQITVKVDYTTPSTTIAGKPINEESNKKNEAISLKCFQNNIIVSTYTGGKYSLLVTDILGQPVQQKTIYTTENSQMIVPIDRKLNGVYFIRCSGNGSTKTISSFLQ